MSPSWKWAAWGCAAFVVVVAIASGGASLSVGRAASCGPSAGGATGSVKGVPKRFVGYYRGAAQRFELGSRGPAILAAIHKVETNFGASELPGVKSGSNAAGAKGPMQFLQPTWDAYGIDGDRDGDKDVYENHDAIFGAANYLSASGAPGDWYRAIFAYNHSDVYVAEVERYAKRFGDFGSATIEVTSCEAGSQGAADLSRAIRLTEPRAYKSLPAELMAAGRPPARVDARIYDNAVWALRHYRMRVTAARETGHASHGDGSALDIVPAGDVGSQAVWDRSTGAFAKDLGWSRGCARSGVTPSCPLVPAIRFIGYDGYPNHGSPQTCGGRCPAHLHVSWLTAGGGTAALVPPVAWAMVFVSPSAGSSS